MSMLSVQIDEKVVEEIYLEEIKKRLEKVDNSMVFWDSKELKRRTCMSWNTILDNFFFEKGFPKVKVGGKWYFPAKETEEYLLNWLREQS